jgi:dTDP-4-amino-4,6-dideoxygalactose transaminase
MMTTSDRVPLFKVFQPKNAGAELEKTLRTGFIAEGPKTVEFKNQIAKFVGNPNVVLMSSCTQAITVAYHISGVGPGTEVISTPLTCVASNMPVLQLGAKLVWADVDPFTGMITAETIRPKITPRTKAILVLHKEGDPARIEEIYALAKQHGIRVIEDSAHAFGTTYEGKKIGSFGDFACFSFQAIKHITTGDGGALTCANEAEAKLAREWKWFGVDRDQPRKNSPWKEDISKWGYKGNMNDLAATLGVLQMNEIETILNPFIENGNFFRDRLTGIPGVTQITRSAKDQSVYWAFCFLAERRDDLIRKLAENGFEANQIHPRNDRYSVFKASACDLPGVDRFDSREICVPAGWWMTESTRERLVETVKSGW